MLIYYEGTYIFADEEENGLWSKIKRHMYITNSPPGLRSWRISASAHVSIKASSLFFQRALLSAEVAPAILPASREN